MKVLGVIPARYASTRFPAKPLIDIAGKPMIQRVYEQAKQCALFDQVIVATDHEAIFDAVKAFDGEVMMTDSSHQNGTERCAEVVRRLKSTYDVVINIQGDEPFVDPNLFNALITAFESADTQIATLIKPIQDEAYIQNPNIIKVVKNVHQEAMYFSRAAIPFSRNTKSTTSFYKHIGLYAYRAPVLLSLVQLAASPYEDIEVLEQLRWLENGYKIKLVETSLEADSIDVPADLDRLLKKYFK